MLLNDPVTLLLVLIPFGLMTLLMLCLSYVGASKYTVPLHWWVAGDVFLAIYRSVPLLQPGVLDTRFTLGWLAPEQAFLLNGLFLQLAICAHTLALARLGSPDGPHAKWLPQLIGLPMLQTLGALLLLRTPWLLPWFFFMLMLGVALQLRTTLPLRIRYRGAWGLIAGQSLVVVFHACNALGLVSNPIPPLAFDEPDMFSLSALAIDFIVSFLFTLSFALMLQEKLRQRVVRLSITDTLTGALNRRGAEPILLREWALATTQRYPLAIAMVDLDHFKHINDRYGHAQGDAALQAFANAATRLKRQTDIFVRWGGEEFLLVFPGTNVDQAQRFLERLSQTLRAETLDPPVPFSIEFSAGLADLSVIDIPTDFETLLRAVDKALYRAKLQRGRVEVVGQADFQVSSSA